MKANQLLALSIAAVSGCGVVNLPVPGAGDDTGSDVGSAGSGSGMGSDLDPPGSHPPGTIYGHIKDERGDTIDFSSGEPVHEHAGPSIDLSSGCPAVYKYAYLTTQQAPVFGREATPNPLAFRVQSDLASTDATASAYRVRTDDGHTLLDWTPMSPDGNGVYTMTLHRDDNEQMQALGNVVQKLHIDARFRDMNGKETTTFGCWEHHPLAAPLQVGQYADGAMFGMSFAANSPISTMLNTADLANGSTGADVATLPIVQTTSEPSSITIATPKPTGMETETAVLLDIVEAVGVTALNCGPVQFDPGCNTYTPTRTTLGSGGPLDGTWMLRVVDDATNTIICSGTGGDLRSSCTIPARATGEAPHGYHAVLSLASSNLGPVASASYGEFTITSSHFTGTPPVAYRGCSQFRNRVINGVTYRECVQLTSAAQTTALETAHIDLDAITLSMTSNIGDAVMPAIAPSTLVFAAQSWDAGNAGL